MKKTISDEEKTNTILVNKMIQDEKKEILEEINKMSLNEKKESLEEIDNKIKYLKEGLKKQYETLDAINKLHRTYKQIGKEEKIDLNLTKGSFEMIGYHEWLIKKLKIKEDILKQQIKAEE